MAFIRIPYTYTRYENSLMATKFDMFCHKPLRSFISTGIAFFYAIYLQWCVANICPALDSDNVSGVLVAVFTIPAFVLTLPLKFLCNRFHWSQKLAVWDITHSGKNRPVWYKALIWVLVLAIVLPGVLAIGFTIVRNREASAYHELMSVVGHDGFVAMGDKIVAVETKGYSSAAQYSRYGIPEEFQAKIPDEVGFALFCNHNEEVVGYYSSSGMSVAGAALAYQRYVEVELVELSSGNVLATNTFWGGTPPYSTKGSENQYGSEPSEDDIRAWLMEIFPSF